ncbi:GATA zinc finger domain-containing protein 8 [Capsicum chacoense]
MTWSSSSSSSIAPVGPPRSPWHSPVPYLFGGLAAMLGLIAFALLILACSYWKLSGHIEENQEGDIEQGNNNNNNSNSDSNDIKMVTPPILEEKFLVIMAGQLKPTYIATPSLSSRASSFGSSSGCTTISESSTEKSEVEEKEEGSSPENREILRENGLNGGSGSTFENGEVPMGNGLNNVSGSISESGEVPLGTGFNDVSASNLGNGEVPRKNGSNDVSGSTSQNGEVPIENGLNDVSGSISENGEVPTGNGLNDVSGSSSENGSKKYLGKMV